MNVNQYMYAEVILDGFSAMGFSSVLFLGVKKKENGNQTFFWAAHTFVLSLKSFRAIRRQRKVSSNDYGALSIGTNTIISGKGAYESHKEA